MMFNRAFLPLVLVMATTHCASTPSPAGASAGAGSEPTPAAIPITDPVVDAPVEPGPRVVGYFTNWAQYRPEGCKFEPADIDAKLFTHINYAFAKIDPYDRDNPVFRLAATEGADTGRLYAEVNALKRKNPELRTLLAVGGWSFNDPPTEWVFSTMASTPESRGQFIRHAIGFVRTHGFDGIDLDWEYPGADDRGGKPEDTKNFTKLLVEFRAAMHAEAKTSGKPELLLTIATPASQWYYRHLELDKIHKPLNWINVMTYDYNGSWDNKTGPNAPLRGEGPNIPATLDAYLAAGIPSHKLVLGMATYGRSWTGVAVPGPAAKGTGPGPKGACTGEEGYLASYEIAQLVREGGYAEGWDEASATPFAYHAASQVWVTFDNPRSYEAKLDVLLEKQLGGAMFWAIDLDDFQKGYPLVSAVNRRLRGAQPPPASAGPRP